MQVNFTVSCLHFYSFSFVKCAILCYCAGITSLAVKRFALPSLQPISAKNTEDRPMNAYVFHRKNAVPCIVKLGDLNTNVYDALRN